MRVGVLWLGYQPIDQKYLSWYFECESFGSALEDALRVRFNQLSQDACLFTTSEASRYLDLIVVTRELDEITSLYGQTNKGRWFELGVMEHRALSTVIMHTVEDPHFSGAIDTFRVDMLGPKHLIMSQPSNYGGDWAHFEPDKEGTPGEIIVTPLPTEISTLHFLGTDDENCRRVAVVAPRYYPAPERMQFFVGGVFEERLEAHRPNSANWDQAGLTLDGVHFDPVDMSRYSFNAAFGGDALMLHRHGR